MASNSTMDSDPNAGDGSGAGDCSEVTTLGDSSPSEDSSALYFCCSLSACQRRDIPEWTKCTSHEEVEKPVYSNSEGESGPTESTDKPESVSGTPTESGSESGSGSDEEEDEEENGDRMTWKGLFVKYHFSHQHFTVDLQMIAIQISNLAQTPSSPAHHRPLRELEEEAGVDAEPAPGEGVCETCEMSTQEQKYSVIEQEALGVVWGLNAGAGTDVSITEDATQIDEAGMQEPPPGNNVPAMQGQQEDQNADRGQGASRRSEVRDLQWHVRNLEASQERTEAAVQRILDLLERRIVDEQQ
uniref:Uncharacterized protein n=1 Tax=Sphaerodactylus townsendi TaxID=933632 RepID=A0ACB8FMK0_9SAUR